MPRLVSSISRMQGTVKLMLLAAACSLGNAWSAQSACPARPRIGTNIAISGTIATSDVMAISIKGCRIVVMVQRRRFLADRHPGGLIIHDSSQPPTQLPYPSCSE